MQGTRFHAQRPRVGHSQFSDHERQHSLRIGFAPGVSTQFEPDQPLLFPTRFGTETNSSGSAREAVWIGVRQARY